VAASPLLPPQFGGCARAAPYDAAARRGLRAPDVAAIAIAKRAYLRQVKQNPLAWQDGNQGLQCYYHLLSCVVVQASESFLLSTPVRSCKFAYVPNASLPLVQVPYLTTSRPLSSKIPPPSSGHSPGVSPADAPCSTPTKRLPSGGGPARGLSPHAPRVASLAQRYAQQAATLAKRVTAGKSAIHGFGAFTKMPHAAGASFRRGC
jgi:hypothetical protein